MILAHGEDSVNNLVSEGAEIACTLLEIYLAHSVYKLVERIFEERQNSALVALCLICGNAVVIGIVLKEVNHFKSNFGALLKVGVDDSNKVTISLAETCIHCGFLAEVS